MWKEGSFPCGMSKHPNQFVTKIIIWIYANSHTRSNISQHFSGFAKLYYSECYEMSCGWSGAPTKMARFTWTAWIGRLVRLFCCVSSVATKTRYFFFFFNSNIYSSLHRLSKKKKKPSDFFTVTRTLNAMRRNGRHGFPTHVCVCV